jgi:hypothetical protein
MDINEIVSKMLKKHYLLNMGAGKLSRWFEVDRDVIYEAKKLAREKLVPSRFPRILVFDIETAPIEAEIFRVWKTNVYFNQVTSDWYMLTWSAKWLFSSQMLSDKLTPEEAVREDDSRLVKNLWDLLDKADIVIAHNGDAFDVPKANTRFLMNGLNPPASYQQIDTKKIAAKQFGFTYNSLAGLAKLFGFDGKDATDHELWTRCRRGDAEALAYMEKYNRQDVKLLEEVYLKMRPWIRAHPNVGLYLNLDYPVCATCSSSNLELIPNKPYYTQTGIYPQYRCKDCGALTRGRRTIQDKDKRAQLLVSQAR